MDSNYTIVVGIDGSPASRRALRWAVREAASCRGLVKAITVWHPTANTIDESALEAQTAGIVKAEVAAVQAEEDSMVPVSAEVIRGKPLFIYYSFDKRAGAPFPAFVTAARWKRIGTPIH